MSGTLYKIVRWAEVFESEETRSNEWPVFIRCPIDLNSTGLIEMRSMGQEGLCAIAVYWLLVQLSGAMPASLRGYICRSKGVAFTDDQLAKKLRISQTTLQESLTILRTAPVNWIEIEDASPEVKEAESLPMAAARERGGMPFGISEDAFRYGDITQIEAGIIDAWNKTPGTVAARTTDFGSQRNRDLRALLTHSEWLKEAEQALSKFPFPNLSGKMSFTTFLKPDTVAMILAETMPYQRTKTQSKRLFEQTEQAPIDHGASLRGHEEREAHIRDRNTREKVYRDSLAAKHGADAGRLTDKQITELDERFPTMRLYEYKLKSERPRAPMIAERLFTKLLHECMEMAAGGKSFDDTEAASDE